MSRPRNHLNVAIEVEAHALLKLLAQKERRSMCQQLTLLVTQAAHQAGIAAIPDATFPRVE